MHGFVRQLLTTGAGAALIVAAGAAAGAQTQSSASGASAQPQKTIQMVPALASLDHTLDAKKAKQGEPVTAKLQKDVKLSEQELPKNTVLEGHVDQVEASEHKSDSTVVVTFDKAKLKSGTELPIKATVMQIAQPVSMMQQPTGEPAGNAMPSGGGGSMGSGGTPRGGGGSSSGAAAPSEPAPQPMQASSTQPSGPQQNGVPGVMLQSDIHQQASATFTAKGKNVHLPDGTQMDVALAVIPAGTRIQ